jgi:uncharacterized membrane protein
MDKLKSRKFWFALIGAVLPLIAEGLTGAMGWDEALTLTIGILISYILGQGYVDGQAASAITEG